MSQKVLTSSSSGMQARHPGWRFSWIVRVNCGGPLLGRQGKFASKYFRTEGGRENHRTQRLVLAAFTEFYLLKPEAGPHSARAEKNFILVKSPLGWTSQRGHAIFWLWDRLTGWLARSAGQSWLQRLLQVPIGWHCVAPIATASIPWRARGQWAGSRASYNRLRDNSPFRTAPKPIP